MRRTRRWATITVSLAAVIGAVSIGGFATVTGAASPTSYVALGDSYTAGPLIATQQPTPLGCLKSDHNYPHLLAQTLQVTTFRDASCSGATTANMTSPQNVTPGPNPPQFDSLDANTQLVTLGIGGNDVGFFDILVHCFSPTPNGTPCQDQFVMGGNDQISNRITATAPKVAAVLQGIHTKSPQAQVLLVAYLAILPESGPGCYSQLPFTPGDVPYLRAKEKEMNAMLAQQAAANNATFIDAYTPSIGHDACQPPCRRWVEPLVPASPAAPVHPNLLGMVGTAAAVLGAPPPVSPAVCPLPAVPLFTG
jgi:lysophospholipase L1-like esterase